MHLPSLPSHNLSWREEGCGHIAADELSLRNAIILASFPGLPLFLFFGFRSV